MTSKYRSLVNFPNLYFRAITLLLSGKDAIAEIAQQVGFANQAHLNVQIKRFLGVTPKKILEHRKNL
ncbi:MAG: AraC family transcriptional regulator [Microcoleus sp.]